MTEDLMLEAKKYIKEPDIIVDLYDITIEWLHPRLIKKFKLPDNYINKNVVPLTEIFEFSKREMLSIIWKSKKTEGGRTITAKLKNGKKYKITAKFKTFIFNKTLYRVGEMKKIIEIKE